MSRLAIIGAGPAGLAAALTGAERGHEVTVFEASDTVGGMAGSFDVAGIRVDFGSHRLHASTDPAFLGRLRDLLGNDLQARERNGRILLRDRWVAFPLRLGDMARRLPPDFSTRVGFDAVVGPLRGPRSRPGPGAGEGPGFLDLVTERLGPTVTDEFYRPYVEKLYGVAPEDLGAELARRRVSARSPLAILAAAFRARKPSGRTFFYPRHGYGQVSEALADAARQRGAAIRFATPVTSVTAGPSPTVTTGASTSDFDAVLSTMPGPALLGMLGPTADPTVVEAASRLRTRAMVLVYLVVDRPRYTPFDAHYLPAAELATSRLSEPKNYRDGDDPPDRTVLCAEVPCWFGDETWAASNAELGERVIEDLRRAGLPDPGSAHRSAEPEVRRLRSVYPVYERATETDRAVVDRWLSAVPGIVSFGRQGLGVPDNLHHVLDMGRAAANAVDPSGPSTADSIDRGRWSDALDRFADNVVVD